MPRIQVLLMEDDAAYSRLVEAALATSEIEFAVHVTDRLATAVSTLNEQAFNLVLLDLNLPDSGGLQTLEAIASASSVPIVVLTGQEDEELAEQSLAMGAQRFLRKTELNTSSLVETMRQAVSPHLQLHAKGGDRDSVMEVFAELAESATSIEHALTVFEQRRLDPVEDIALTSARTHLRKMKTVIARHRSGYS
ncbi:MAG: hypothetical protein CMJ64_01245 [Planctomycetaceae bacterium]|nr:hypothetical protein [Planctomycetaceae bacterium]